MRFPRNRVVRVSALELRDSQFFTERNGNVFVDPLFVGRGNFRREIWVDPASLYEEERGTVERPYKSIEAALNSLPPYDPSSTVGGGVEKLGRWESRTYGKRAWFSSKM